MLAADEDERAAPISDPAGGAPDLLVESATTERPGSGAARGQMASQDDAGRWSWHCRSRGSERAPSQRGAT